MQYRRLGRTGLKVSAICLGTMNFGWSADEPTSFAIMDAALEAGIDFFDTADIYSYWHAGNRGGESETIIGKWMKARQNRRQIVLATKVRGRMWEGANGQGLSRIHIMQAVEDSLHRLQTDYIDLYQVHHPDWETPLDETLEALDRLVQAGKVLYIGASNYPAWLLMKALWVSDARGLARFDSIQPHYSLLHRSEFERELESAVLDQGVGVIPYSPLAAGFLTGKYTRENRSPDTTRQSSGLIKQLIEDDRAYTVLDVLQRIADAHAAPMAQIALAWLLARPSITAPIIGARTVEQLHEIVGATEIELIPEQVEALSAVSAGY
ncbi:MAG: aldo/keto reductase [Phototrophicales bacterium]|nr:MAG: aldo/keto reductase [Phototrophicales bacterium]